MNIELKMFTNELLREAKEYGISPYDYEHRVYFDNWLYFISIEQRKYSGNEIVKSDFSEMMCEFINFFSQNGTIFEEKGQLDLYQYCELFEEHGQNELFTEPILQRYRITNYLNFITCLLNSFRLAILEETFPLFLEQLKVKASKLDIFNPNVLVNMKYWLGYIMWGSSTSSKKKNKMFFEIASFLRNLSATPIFGTMISVPTLYKYLQSANRDEFTPWSELSLSSGTDLLLRYFVLAENEVDWPDIVFERLNNLEIKNLDLETWMITHLKLQSNFSDAKIQERIDVMKKYYHEKFVYMTGGGYGMTLEPTT